MWTEAAVAAASAEAASALIAVASSPAGSLLTRGMAALLLGEWDDVRAWLAHPGSPDSREHALLADRYRAFTGAPHDGADGFDVPPNAWTDVHAALQATASQGMTDAERTLTVFTLLAHELLAPQPDAARERLTLHVVLPDGWQAWSAHNLRMGDAAFDIVMTRIETGIEVVTEQTEGAVPATLVLETTVRAPVTRVEIDDRPAELALRPYPDRVVAPVQLALDAVRTVRVFLDG